jgi:hypothetical protein
MASSIAAAQPVDLNKFLDSKNQVLSNKSSTTSFNTNQFDSKLGANSFRWNNGEIKPLTFDQSVSKEQQYRTALNEYFIKVAGNHGANKRSLTKVEPDRVHNTGRGPIIGLYQQRIDGLEVFGRFINLMINQKNEYVASSGYFATAKRKPRLNYAFDESEALAKAFKISTGISISGFELTTKTAASEYVRLNKSVQKEGVKLSKNSRVKKVFFPIDSKNLVSAYYVEAETNNVKERTSLYFSYVIDGTTGETLFKNNLTTEVTTTYNVFADSSGSFIPFDGPQGNELTPHPTGDIADTPAVGETFTTANSVMLDHAGLSTGDPWLTETELTTAGNNVDAYADISGEDGFDEDDVRPDMTAANTFDYGFETFSDGVTEDGQKHSVVSLFYVNNFLHDWFYDHGFDEAAGNAQENNFGRGGIGGDRLNVEAQDNSGTNNANMSTPADGSNPRMQMFIWTFLSEAEVAIAGVSDITSLAASFGPSDYNVTGVMELIDDGVGTLTDGCESATADLTSKIVIIDRGDCNFTVKVKNAQDQGAVGVIMVNNVTGDVITQGGEDDTVTIPSMMVSLEKGDEIKAALVNNAALEATLTNTQKPLDGTLDNGIVAHEWGHYLSNRLVGNANGLTNNQGRSMGEGWSDFVALLMTVKESDNLIVGNENFQGVYSASTFIGDAYSGIRRAPYTTDMAKNALTFKHIEKDVSLPLTHPVAFGVSGSGNAEVHATGEIWSNVLWEAYVGLINKPGNSFIQAQNQMKDYLIAGLKLTPNAPTLLEARDAILASTLANDPTDFEIFRDAFIKRGMGAGAIAPARSSSEHIGVVEDFSEGTDLSASIRLDSASIDVSSCDNDSVLDVGESATIMLSYKNFSSSAVPAFNVSLSSGDDVTFENSSLTVGAMPSFGDSASVSTDITVISSSFMQELTINAITEEVGVSVDDFVEPGDIEVSILSQFDFSKVKMNDSMDNSLTSNFDWSIDADSGVSAFVVDSSAWYGEDSSSPGSSSLILPSIRVASEGDLTIDFDHFYFFESSEDDNGQLDHWDAGVVEVSVDGGEWIDIVTLGGSLLEEYNGFVDTFNAVLGGRNAYTFTRDPDDLVMSANRITLPDGLVNGRNIQIRFRIGTDANTGDFGWLIDNVVVDNAVDPLFSDIVAEDGQCLSANAPVADAGIDQQLVSRNSDDMTVNLTGSAIDDDGDSLTIGWQQTAGPAVMLENSGTLTPSFVIAGPTESTRFVFELSVDDGGLTDTSSVAIQINPNQAPTVSITSGSVVEGQTFTFDSVARDNENDELTYSWSQVSGSPVTLSDTTASNPSFTAPDVSVNMLLVFELVVNDGNFDSEVATGNVTVTASAESSSGGGGGGSLPWATLALILAAIRFRRKLSSTEAN